MTEALVDTACPHMASGKPCGLPGAQIQLWGPRVTASTYSPITLTTTIRPRATPLTHQKINCFSASLRYSNADSNMW